MLEHRWKEGKDHGGTLTTRRHHKEREKYLVPDRYPSRNKIIRKNTGWKMEKKRAPSYLSGGTTVIKKNGPMLRNVVPAMKKERGGG